MIYSISEEVPAAWDHIISAFIIAVEYDIEFNNGVPIDNLEFMIRHGYLFVNYSGGNKITDAFAFFAREMSAGVCTGCALPSTRSVFGLPKCDDCD